MLMIYIILSTGFLYEWYGAVLTAHRSISAIQGYHEYKDIWENPIIGEELKCQRKIGNQHESLAVAILKEIDGLNTIVGPVSSKIAASCNAFIRRGGIIVTGNRRYNVDLIQGGLELPCKLHFMISSPS